MSLHRILLVEEDALECASRAIILVAAGYRVATASSAAEASIACADAMPDLVLVGLQERPEKISAVAQQLRGLFPSARVAVLMHKSHRLSAVALDDVISIRGELPGDFLQRVALVLALPAPMAAAAAR